MENLDKFVHKGFIEQEYRFSEAYSYIDKYMSPDIYNRENPDAMAEINGHLTIWIMWMQGMENAPEIVKKCYGSICRNKPDKYDIVLLTMKNISKYIKLPSYVMEKYDMGIITATHLSDIIRIEILGAYGGCWIDATVFCGNSIPEYMLSDMFFFKLESILSDPVIKMSSWWLAANKENRMIHAARHVLLRYWEREEKLIDYFLLHIIMSKIIDEDLLSQEIFRRIPFFNSKNAQVLVGNLGLEYSEKSWDIMKDASFIQKLSYKKRYIKGDIYNFYMALLDGKLDC